MKEGHKLIFCAIILLATATPAFAVGNLHVGRTEIHPSVGVTYTYDDNVYLTNGVTTREESSGIIVVSPALQLKNEGKRKTFYLEYGAQIYKYMKSGPEDRTTQSLTLGYHNEFPGGLMLTLRDSYVITDDPASSETTDKDKRTQHVFFAEVGSRLYDRLSFHVNYGGTVHDYKEFALRDQDRSSYTIGGRLELRLLPKTSFFTGYSRTDTEYETVVSGDVRDSKSQNFDVGVKGDVTSKLSVRASMGYQTTTYEQVGKEDFRSVVSTLSLDHNATAFVKLSLAFSRAFTESFYTDGANTYHYYVENKVTLGLAYVLSHKVSTNFGVYYGVNDYPNGSGGVDRKDKLYGLNAAVAYSIQPWLAVGAGYGYHQRNSDAVDGTSEDYKNNQYSAFIKASF